jgi:hypothetical protein
MPTYRFELDLTPYGAEMDDMLDDLDVARLLVLARRDTGDEAATAASWREHWGQQLGDGPELVGFEIWSLYVDDAPAPRFTLFYFPWCDGGHLYFAGEAREAALALWQDGFRPGPGDDPGLDAAALTDAFNARD